MSYREELRERLHQLRRRIAEACERCSRDPQEVILVGASKGQPTERLEAAWELGQSIFGENRVQEALRKAVSLPAEVEWHLIGPLQTNKVKPAVRLFRCIHSLDREKIVLAIEREAARVGRSVDCFIEVNLGGESSKHGFSPDTLATSLHSLCQLEHLRIVGLMAIPPLEADPQASRPWFRTLRQLRDDLARQPEWSDFPGFLSMGMSHDFEVAVEEGATHVRVGTALFGPRR